MDIREAEALRQEVEERYANGEDFSIAEIQEMMKRTGLSFKQIMGQTIQLKKDIKKAQKAAEAEGKPFDQEAYLRMRRQMAGR